MPAGLTEEVPTGICLPLRGFGAEEALRLARLTEELGYDSVWVSELASYDAIAVATAIAAVTERITIGTAIVPFTTRSPALHAMGYSTLGSIGGERTIIGYGLSTEPIIEGWHGQDLPKALPTIRDLFAILDQAMTGQATDHEGKVLSSKGFRLEHPASTPPRRVIGALGPKMREFTRNHADGLILNFAPRSTLAGFAERERPADKPGHELVLPIRVAVGDDLDAQVRRFRRETASYMRVPVYEHSLRELGFGDVVDHVLGQDSLQEMADALPDEFADDMGLIGTEAECREKMARMVADGVTPLLVPITDPGDGETFERTIRTLAPGA